MANVQDINMGAGSRPASLVLPDDASAGSAAGIMWFHWLEYGSPTSNRSEFLGEAAAMADRGVVSVLVDGTFPWFGDPESIAHDTAALDADLAMAAAGYELLLARPEVDASRTAFVGHDFGSMYQSVLFAQDRRPLGFVMMAPTARWADWFARYWVISDEAAAYTAALAPYDPAAALPSSRGRPVLLQFANDDKYVPADVSAEISLAAGPDAETRHYDCGHGLNEAARADRHVWLANLLGLAAE